MDTLKAIETRRSVKSFDPDHKFTSEEEKKIISLAMLSPTAFNIQNWRFVVVKDVDLRKKIREIAWNQPQITDSSLLVIICADMMAWEKNPERYWKNLPKEVLDFILPTMKNYYTDKEQVQRDECMRSCAMAAQTLMLSAKAMGYDSCPMTGFDFDALSKLINLPEDHIVTMIVAIGKAAKEPFPRGGQLDYNEVVITDRF